MKKFFIIQRPASKSLPSFSLKKLPALLSNKFPEISVETVVEHDLCVQVILKGNSFNIGITTERHDIMPLAVHLRTFLDHDCSIVIAYKSSGLKLLLSEFREAYNFLHTAEINAIDLKDDYVDTLSAGYLFDLVTRLLDEESMFDETDE